MIDPTRGPKPAEELLGSGWSGTLVHDGWSVYDQFDDASHQQCVRHLQRRGLGRQPHLVWRIIAKRARNPEPQPLPA